MESPETPTISVSHSFVLHIGPLKWLGLPYPQDRVCKWEENAEIVALPYVLPCSSMQGLTVRLPLHFRAYDFLNSASVAYVRLLLLLSCPCRSPGQRNRKVSGFFVNDRLGLRPRQARRSSS
jgi:hypothetical protein